MRYLDPKADLTFKKVFGEHPDLVMSLLNALLPFDKPEEEIVSVEYLPVELVPKAPWRKNSIVDVRCKDERGRQFIVEMQMVWSREFKQRVLFNASKAYVRQLGEGEDYDLLQPVYSLNLVNEIFEPDMEQYYHYYRLVHNERTDKVIDGLHLVFVELPKFTPHTYSEKRMQVLWLRYLTEINDRTREVPKELMANPEVRKAVSQIEESAYTDAQLIGYDKFWDTISVERTLVNSVYRRYKEGMEKGLQEGMEKGLQEGMEKGLQEGMEKGMQEGMEKGMEKGIQKGLQEGGRRKQLEIARNMKAAGIDDTAIARLTGLSADEIAGI